MTADYIEKKPVPFRKKLVKDLLKELNKNDDGAAGIKTNRTPPGGNPSRG